jgi:hypothetical protein
MGTDFNNNANGEGFPPDPGNLTPEQNPPANVAPPAKNKPVLLIVIIALVLVAVGVAVFALLRPKPEQATLKTYFEYSAQDIDKLKALQSEYTIDVAEVQKWEDKTYELVEEHGTIDVDSSKLYAYMAVAQMDAAALSQQAHGEYMGTVAPLSKEVLCEFYPDSCSVLVATEDAYSKELASIVFAKVKARIAEDTAQIKPYPVQTGADLWNGPAPQVGLSAGTFKPWMVDSSDQFRSTPPVAAGSAEQQAQLKTVKETLAAATNDEKAIVVKWAGGPGTRTPPGIWLTLATDYMLENAVPLDKYLETQALVTMSMADAVASVFDSKYTYFYKRPNMFDTSIVTIMPTPNHPGYPAGHATISWAAATVLSRYLPENQAEWERQAKEASDSRTIGGIHFPMDNEAGTTLGKNVGTAVLENW